MTGSELSRIIDGTMTKRDPFLQGMRRQLQDRFADFGLFLNWHVTEDEEKKFIFYGSNPLIKNGKWTATTDMMWLEENLDNAGAMMIWINRCLDDIGSPINPYYLWTFVKTTRKDYMEKYPEFAQKWREYKLEKCFEKD
jgi:hypothetical protein